jgi:hypothetical protein
MSRSDLLAHAGRAAALLAVAAALAATSVAREPCTEDQIGDPAAHCCTCQPTPDAATFAAATTCGPDGEIEASFSSFRPSYGFRLWCAFGPFVYMAAHERVPGISKPVDITSSSSQGLGLRLAPVRWLALDAMGLIGYTEGRSTDVNLRGWYGPDVWWNHYGVRLHATAGPRFTLKAAPRALVLRPTVSVAFTQLWGGSGGGDRFRSWGGPARWLELGVGVELVLADWFRF